MEEVTFFVPGEPRGKCRPRFNRSTGRAYTDSETRAYEEKIISFYRMKYGAMRFDDDDFLHMQVLVTLPVPKSANKETQIGMKCWKILPRRKPDVDNILKVVMDALNGVAYKDDSCIAALFGQKRYGEEPGLRISIYKMPARRC